MNDFDRGFRECEETHLIPMQLWVQEIILDLQKQPEVFSMLSVRNELKMILIQSDFRKQWAVKP